MAWTVDECEEMISAIKAAMLLYYQNGGVIEDDIDGRKVRRDLSQARNDLQLWEIELAKASGGGNARNYAVFGGMNG